MSETATPTEPATLPPDEQAVLDWCKIRLADLHERSGVQALTLTCIRYSHTGEIAAKWAIHQAGVCSGDQPSIAQGVRAMREKLEARP